MRVDPLLGEGIVYSGDRIPRALQRVFPRQDL